MQTVCQGWAPVLLEVRPFQDRDPLAGHAPRFRESRRTVIRLVQNVAHHDDVKRSVSERELLGRALEERACRVPACDCKQRRTGVDARDVQSPAGKRFREDPGSGPHVEHPLRDDPVEAEVENARNLQESNALRRAQFFGG